MGEYNKLVENIYELKIGLTIEFNRNKYGVPSVLNNIHQENDCNDATMIIF